MHVGSCNFIQLSDRRQSVFKLPDRRRKRERESEGEGESALALSRGEDKCVLSPPFSSLNAGFVYVAPFCYSVFLLGDMSLSSIVVWGIVPLFLLSLHCVKVAVFLWCRYLGFTALYSSTAVCVCVCVYCVCGVCVCCVCVCVCVCVCFAILVRTRCPHKDSKAWDFWLCEDIWPVLTREINY